MGNKLSHKSTYRNCYQQLPNNGRTMYNYVVIKASMTNESPKDVLVSPDLATHLDSAQRDFEFVARLDRVLSNQQLRENNEIITNACIAFNDGVYNSLKKLFTRAFKEGDMEGAKKDTVRGLSEGFTNLDEMTLQEKLEGLTLILSNIKVAFNQRRKEVLREGFYSANHLNVDSIEVIVRNFIKASTYSELVSKNKMFYIKYVLLAPDETILKVKNAILRLKSQKETVVVPIISPQDLAAA